MPTNLEIATSKFLHPSNSEKFFPHDRDSIQDAGQPFPMVEFLHEELTPAYEITKPEYEDDDLINPLHSHIMRVINKDADDYQGKYGYLVYLMNDGSITVDEFMHYGRILTRAEVQKQVAETPVNTGNLDPNVSKLPSQSVNCDTPSGSSKTEVRGILGTRFIRRIASKLSANWGSKGKS